jgi:hypothetical protein
VKQSTSNSKQSRGSREATQSKPNGDTARFFRTTTDVVQQAASILEEELAAGILVAKKMGTSISSVKNSKEKPAPEIERLREDAHQIADMIVDFLALAQESMLSISKKLSDTGASEPTRTNPSRS